MLKTRRRNRDNSEVLWMQNSGQEEAHPEVETEEVETTDEEPEQEEETSAVVLALATATQEDADENRRALLRRRDAFLVERRDGLTTFEADVRGKIDEERKSIEDELLEIDFVAKMAGYKFLSLDVLSWRHEKPLTISYREYGTFTARGPNHGHRDVSIHVHPPRLALFLKGPVITFCDVWTSEYGTQYPPVIQSQYIDIREKLAAHGSARPTLTTNFTGVIPGEIRDLLASPPKPELRWETDPMLLAEAPLESWSLVADKVVYPQDPIVVRLGGGKLWILGQFDPTPMEQYLLDEFAQ